MKHKLIILEGPDGSGKTTLARQLAERLSAVSLHLTCTKALVGGLRDYQLHVMRDVAENLRLGHTVVLDRSWISEAVYGPVMRPKGPSYVAEIKTITESLNPFYIFCVRKDNEAWHAENKDKAHPYTKRQFRKILRGYQEAYEELHGDFFFRDRVMTLLMMPDRFQSVDIVLDRLTPYEAPYKDSTEAVNAAMNPPSLFANARGLSTPPADDTVSVEAPGAAS